MPQIVFIEVQCLKQYITKSITVKTIKQIFILKEKKTGNLVVIRKVIGLLNNNASSFHHQEGSN